MSPAARPMLGPDELTADVLALREKWGVTEVETGEFPRWFRPLVTAAVNDGRLPKPDFSITHPFYAFQHSARHCGGESWIDHCGRLKLPDGSWVIVSEPYQLSCDAFQQLQKFCNLLRLTYRVQPESWWYPGSTLRITIWREGDFGN